MEKTLQELATLVGGRVVGDESIVITETRGFEQAVKQSITFAIGEYVEHIALCQAGAVIVESEVKDAPMAQIVVDNAKAALRGLYGDQKLQKGHRSGCTVCASGSRICQGARCEDLQRKPRLSVTGQCENARAVCGG